MLKYSLGTLFLVMALVGLGCAAVANYSDVWAEAMVTAAVTILLLAALAAVYGRRSFRPFAAGFVLVGGAYFLLTFVEVFGIRDELLTSRAVDRLYVLKQKASAGADDARDTRRGYGGSGYPASGHGYGGYGYSGAGYDSGYGGSMEDPFGAPPAAGMSGMDMSGYGMYSAAGVVAAPVISNAPPVLQDIGHALWTLVLALAGGVAAQVIHRASRKSESPA